MTCCSINRFSDCSRLPGFKSSLNQVHLKIHHVRKGQVISQTTNVNLFSGFRQAKFPQKRLIHTVNRGSAVAFHQRQYFEHGRFETDKNRMTDNAVADVQFDQMGYVKKSG